MKEVLNWLALADGELAMPNGNDWSLFLYDQITSYSTNACFLADPDALMLENLAFKMIKARQSTTNDGSWLLRPDVGARRMGVEAHRVMMTWLMHEMISTAYLNATDWNEFNNRYGKARVFDTQNIVRASSKDRFTCFSWAEGIKSYTGYIAANSVDRNKIIVPFKKYNTGNFLGWYEVSGHEINAIPIVRGVYDLSGNSYIINGELNTNDETLNRCFSIFSSPGNAVVYMDYVVANQEVTILKEKGGLMGISIDEFTNIKRTLYSELGSQTYSSEDANLTIESPWLNIDDALGIVSMDGKQYFIGDVVNNNSIYTAQLCPLYSDKERVVMKGDLVDSRICTYYSNVTSPTTKMLSSQNQQLITPEGWNGCIVADVDSLRYFFLSNYAGDNTCSIANVRTSLGSPVFKTHTAITPNGSSASFQTEKNHSVVNILRYFISGSDISAIQNDETALSITVSNNLSSSNEIKLKVVSDDNNIIAETITLLPSQAIEITLNGNNLNVTPVIETRLKATYTLPQKKELYDVGGRKVNSNSPTHSVYISGREKLLR